MLIILPLFDGAPLDEGASPEKIVDYRLSGILLRGKCRVRCLGRLRGYLTGMTEARLDDGTMLAASARSVVVATRVEPALWAKVAVAAADHGLTVSDYVRRVLIERVRGRPK